jgi:plastocyanin
VQDERLCGERAGGPSIDKEVLAMNVRVTGLVYLVTGLLVTAIGGTSVYAQQTVTLNASDFQFDQTSITVPAGQPITFEINNIGERNHDLHVEGQGVVFEVVSGTGAV